LDDLIVGAYKADPNGNESGKSYVIFGKTDTNAIAPSNLRVSTPPPPFTRARLPAPVCSSALILLALMRILSLPAAFDESGFSVSSAGDVNGDGLDDLIVGAYKADPNGKVMALKLMALLLALPNTT
jgi:hypothetical protein